MSQMPLDATNRSFLCENLSTEQPNRNRLSPQPQLNSPEKYQRNSHPGVESRLNDENVATDMSSMMYLQSKQRKINHRRNKSEPLIISNLNSTNINLESSSTSTTSNDSNQSFERKKRKSFKIHFNSSFDHAKQQDKSSLANSSTTKKRKSWYNPFQSTYRQRHEELKKFFPTLPSEERLIVDYSCAWQKEILIQGRMYISQNYLCFYANFLKWETSLILKFTDIQTLTREKTAKVIPNAIEIKSMKNEKYFFASFATRDKSYARIFQIWQTILNHQPLNSEQLWNIIHQSYGNDLDMTTDEEDNYQQTNHTQSLSTHFNESKLSQKEEIEDQSSHSSHLDEEFSHQQSQSIPKPTYPNFQMSYLTKCPCQNHLSTQLIDRTYPIAVEDLFDCVFNNKDFLDAYHQSRRIKNYQSNQWTLNEQTGKRERLCTYNVQVSAVFGETTISSNEKQVIDCEMKNSHYIIDTEVRNEGIKYADNFFIASRYCLYQTAPNKSHLKVTCEVRYIKSVMMIIKSFIEKNAMAALQDSYTDLNNRLGSWSSASVSSTSVKHDENSSNDQQTSSIIGNGHENETIVRKRSTKKQHSTEKDHSARNNHSIDNMHTHRQISSSSTQRSLIQFLVPFCLFTLIVLLCVNIFLFIKLNSINRMTDRLVEKSPIWLNNQQSSANDPNNWSFLLKQQEEYYQERLANLQKVLSATHSALKNVTKSLYQVTKITQQSNSNAI